MLPCGSKIHVLADNAGSNKMTGTGKDAAKLDRETEETHREYL